MFIVEFIGGSRYMFVKYTSFFKKLINLKYMFLFILYLLFVVGSLLFNPVNYQTQLMLSSAFAFIAISISGRQCIFPLLGASLIIIVLKGFEVLSILQLLEVFAIFYLHNKLHKNIIVSCLLYWCVVGYPLSITYLYIANLSINVISLFMIFLVMTNRLINVLIADILITYLPWKKILKDGHQSVSRITFSAILTHLCSATIIVPLIVFFVVTGFTSRRDTKQIIHHQLIGASKYASSKIGELSEVEKKNLYLGNPLQTYKLKNMLNFYTSTSERTMIFEVYGPKGQLLINSNPNIEKTTLPYWNTSGELKEISTNFYHWQPQSKELFPKNNPWDGPIYILHRNIDDLDIFINVPYSFYYSGLVSSHVNLLKLLIPITLIFVAFTLLLKTIILSSIHRLINITNDLPSRLKRNESIFLGESNIFEINSLVSNFQLMANNLSNMLQDINAVNKELTHSQQLLIRQANFDSLTGLPNRHYFTEYANNLIQSYKENSISEKINIYENNPFIAFLLLDLDKFKQVNDTLGHQCGDFLLQEISSRIVNMLENFQENKPFIARLGGDEFVVIAAYKEIDIINKISASIIECINEPLFIDDKEIHVGVSIGISLYPQHGSNLSEIFMKSDASMYKAKGSGGNAHCYYYKL
jgi:diguanylate cyclase (GGDEF)-like protein